MPASYFKAIARDSSECNMILLFQDGEFNWNKLQQGSILSSTFWGYISTQMLGGYLANRFNAKHVIGWSVLLSAVATVLTPLAASFGFPYVIAARVLTGLGQGVVFPSSYALYAYWAPPRERGTLVGLVTAGKFPLTVNPIFPFRFDCVFVIKIDDFLNRDLCRNINYISHIFDIMLKPSWMAGHILLFW